MKLENVPEMWITEFQVRMLSNATLNILFYNLYLLWVHSSHRGAGATNALREVQKARNYITCPWMSPRGQLRRDKISKVIT